MPHPPRRLRVSVTDRCNFRCHYCMPPEGIRQCERGELLTLEALGELVQWLTFRLGIERIKLTGGEPLVRRGLDRLIARVARISPVREVSLTTNGSLLDRQAESLKTAGLDRVTVSLDSLDEARYRELTRGGRLEQALSGIAAADAAGLMPIKLNAVLLESGWRTDVPRLLDFAALKGYQARFIELMRTGTEREWCSREFVAVHRVRTWLMTQAELLPVPMPACGPARLEQIRWKGTTVEIGWIAPRSHPFCDACDRLRLDARGRLHRCLMDGNFFDIASVLQDGDESEAATQLLSYLNGKAAPVCMDRSSSMSVIGG